MLERIRDLGVSGFESLGVWGIGSDIQGFRVQGVVFFFFCVLDLAMSLLGMLCSGEFRSMVPCPCSPG